MFKTLVKPEILFLFGTLQALLPYAVWSSSGLNQFYTFDVSILPTIIWCCGCACFWLGTRMISGRSSRLGSAAGFEFVQQVDPRITKLMFVIVLLSLGPQFLSMIAIYGGIPILNFLSGTAGAASHVDTMLNDSALGQVAFLVLTLNLLNSLIFVLIIQASKTESRKDVLFLLIVGSLVEAFGCVMGGKRQSLFMAVWFIFVGLSLYSNDPVGTVLRAFRVRSPTLRRSLYVIGPLVALAFFQIVGQSRQDNGIETEGTEAFRYLELPLLNLEYQCELAGMGPNEFEPLGLFSALVPKRAVLMFGDRFTMPLPPPKLEPTSPTGFFGDLHWYTGLPGVIAFAFGAGAVSKYCYVMASRSLFFLLCYCQIAWTLLAAHTYNHFLNLPLIPLPALMYFLATLVLNSNARQAKGMLARNIAPEPALQLQLGRKS